MIRIIITLCFLLLINCQKHKEYPPVQLTEIHMDTYATILIYDRDYDENYKKKSIEKGFKEISYIEKIGNVYSDSSELYHINVNAGKMPVSLTNEMKYIIEHSLKYCDLTKGAFDISVFPIVKLWNFLSENPKVPDEQSIKEKLKLVNYKNVILQNNTISFKANDMGIDLGGFLKGYTVDKVVSLLKKDGFKKFIVNMGGQLGIYVVSDDTAKIKIQHPRDSEKFWGEFKINEGSVATSGDYERYFEVNGIRYHHILNPFTGYPANDCISVTIVTEKGELADALSTGVFVMGRKKGMDFINNLDDVEGVIVYKENGMFKSIVSDGMINKYRYIEYGQ